VAFVHLPTIFYDQILDLGATEPVMAMPMGLMYLSATLKQRSNVSEVFLIDYSAAASDLRSKISSGEWDLSEYLKGPERFIAETAQSSAQGRVPDTIAVSLMYACSRPIALQIVEYLSRLWPDALVVFGGNYATNDVPSLLEHPDIDFVCRGEAEWAFPEFVNALARPEEPAVKGFYSRRDITGDRPITLKCDYPEDLDELPFPDWDLIDVNVYMEAKLQRKHEFAANKGTRAFSMMTMRGCPFQCTFCASHTVHGRKMRFRSIENVLSEMREIYDRFGVSVFIPEDDLFVANKKRTLALLAGIKGLGIPNLEMQFANTLCVNTMDEEIIDALCEAGMKYFHLAVESGSTYTQRHLIKKRVNLDLSRRLVKYANDRKLYTRVNFIIGFPNEKMEHIQETIDFAKALSADWKLFFVASPLLGSEMFDQFYAMGVLDFNTRNWERTYWDRGFDTKDFKAREVVEIAYRANLEANFLHNRQMRLGNWELALGVFTDVANRHPFHIIAQYQILLCLENLGRHEEASLCLKNIHHLVTTVDASAEMLRKYGDMVPDMVERLRRFEMPLEKQENKK